MTTANLLVTIGLTAVIFGYAGYLAGCWTVTDRQVLRKDKLDKKKERREYLLFLYIFYIGNEHKSTYENAIFLLDDKKVEEKIKNFESYHKALKSWRSDIEMKFTEWQTQKKKVDRLINFNDDEEEDENSYS